MKITAITATYGRPEALELCEKYMRRQTRQPDQWLILDGEEPMSEKVFKAVQGGDIIGDAVIVFEDDDFYSNDWISWCERQLEKGYEIVGEGYALYYNVNQRWWNCCNNIRHASLCSTAFRSTLYRPLLNLIPAFDNQFFDTRLWRIDCRRYLSLPDYRQGSKRRILGIKGMPGLRRGYSEEHKPEIPPHVKVDPSMKKLWQLIGPDAEPYAKFYIP